MEGVGTLGQLLRVMRGNAKWEDLLVDHANHTTLEWERIADESLDTEYPDAELPHKRTTEEEAENDEYRLDRYVPPTYQYEFPKQTQHSEQQHDPDPWDRELVPGQEDDSLWEILNTINLDHKRLVVYDKAGAGKSVFSLRVKTFLTSDEARTRFFQKRAPLVVRWHGGWKGQGTTVAEALMLDPSIKRLVEDEAERAEFIRYALDSQRVVIILDGFDQFGEPDRATPVVDTQVCRAKPRTFT